MSEYSTEQARAILDAHCLTKIMNGSSARPTNTPKNPLFSTPMCHTARKSTALYINGLHQLCHTAERTRSGLQIPGFALISQHNLRRHVPDMP